jgi:hypothetical protein
VSQKGIHGELEGAFGISRLPSYHLDGANWERLRPKVYAPRTRSLLVGDLVGLDLIDRVVLFISGTSVPLTWAFPFSYSLGT